MAWGWALLVGATLFGSAAQRVTGLGFVLVMAPVALLLLEASQAISLAVLSGMLLCVLNLAFTWRALRARRVVALTGFTVLAMLPGLWVSDQLGEAWSRIVAGILVVIAVSLLAVRQSQRAQRIAGLSIVAGSGSGLMIVLAGLGGPAAAMYGIARDWTDDFVPNLQMFLLITAPVALVGHGLPTDVPGPVLVSTGTAIVLGTAAGSWLARRIPRDITVRITQAAAVLGGIAAIVQGVLMLLRSL